MERITKPAGCALQLLGLSLLLGGCVVVSSGLRPGAPEGLGSTVLGFVLMIGGLLLLKLGRKPAM